MRSLLWLSAVALVMVACGGARETDLQGTPPGNDASTTVDTGIDPGEDGGTSEDASPGEDVVVIVDASKPDVAPPYKDPGIWCGQSFCTPSTQYCCNDKDFQQNPTYVCQATSTIAGCVLGVKVSCDSQADCPSTQICCGGLQNGSYDEVSCKPTCTGVVNFRNQIRFCDPKAPVDECKQQNQLCKASNALKGYYVCQ